MVIGSGIFIDNLRKSDKTHSTRYRLADYLPFFILSITLFELNAGATNPEKSSDLKDLLPATKVLPFTNLEATMASNIYQALKKTNQIIEFRDIFIAATCITNSLSLVTLNKKHFERIANLKLFDLSSLIA
jgi:predicted nucleic acid-binding protein